MKVDLQLKSDIKRFKLPAVIKTHCLVCGCGVQHDMRDEPTEFPFFGVTTNYPLYCPECDDYFDVPIRLTLTLHAQGSYIEALPPE